MNIITSAPIIRETSVSNACGADEFMPFNGNTDLETYFNAESNEDVFYSPSADEYYDASGQKLKNFFMKIGQGLKKGVGAIVKASRWVVSKSKNLAQGVKKVVKGGKPKGRALRHQRTSAKGGAGSDVFTQTLLPATATTPAEKIVDVEGQKFSTVDIPAGKPIVVSTDPVSGQKTVGVEYLPQEVAAVPDAAGNYEYYPDQAVSGGGAPTKGMDTTTKVLLIAGGAVVLGVIIYLIVKKK